MDTAAVRVEPDSSERGMDWVREIELLAPAQVTLLCDRRKFSPYGLAGGEDGARGRALLISACGDQAELPGKCTLQVGKNDSIRIETPGGGGWGVAAKN